MYLESRIARKWRMTRKGLGAGLLWRGYNETLRCSEMEAVTDAIQSNGPIPLASVKNWMQSSDSETRGAMAALLEEYRHRITPSLSIDEIAEYLVPLYEQSIKENPQGEYVLSRYEAVWSIVGWYRSASQDEEMNKQPFLQCIKELMERLYMEGDSEIRHAITCGALEHILEEPRWREFFNDWRKHPILRESYEHAMEWAEWYDSQDS